MSEYPKTLILTTNRTAAGEPVYAPCGDVRELISQWRKQGFDSTFVDKIHNRPTPAGAAMLLCAELLEEMLQPSGDLLVARPLQIDVEYPLVKAKLLHDEEKLKREICSMCARMVIFEK